MAVIDYDALRRIPESGNGDSSETVAVNHRALITRTLSKYPVDHALFRELIQNSADAGATTVRIDFTTDGAKPVKLDNILDVHKATVSRLRISNDGMHFRPEDWDRLREIAKGNPDETKIGAFGVGFYSVFAVTDKPMVISGPTAMSFYYEGDQLRYRRIPLPADAQPEANIWTTIDLPYSSPKPLPDLPHFTSFLAQSLTFVKLQKIELTVDDISFLSIQKIKSDPKSLQIPREIKLTSLDQTMKLERVEAESVQIKARYLNATQLGKSDSEVKGIMSFGLKFIQAFTAEPERPSEYTDAVLFLRNITGYILTNPSASFAKKLKDAIMKPPPRHASVSMIALNKDEADTSQLKSGIATQIFPKNFADAKVFIGFPTKQTTALKSHIATPQAIPTMERAAVDTANAYVKDWNKEMMYMAGVLTRIVYGSEMQHISLMIPQGKEVDNNVDEDIYSKAGFAMRQFYFENSTPDARIGQYIATGFWKSASSVPLVTTKGVRPSTEARAMEDITFLKDVPMIPKSMYDNAPEFHNQVKSLGLIRSVDANDIKNEFSRRPLDVDDTVAFLKWAIRKLKTDELTLSEIRAMIGYALLADSQMGTVDMRSLYFYHNVTWVPASMPVPYTCLPYGVAKEIRNAELEMLGWKPLDITTWLTFLTSSNFTLPLKQNLTVTPEFATDVLIAISKHWFSLTKSDQTAIFDKLRGITCIPTQKGMKKPGESYLRQVKLFPDLPVVDEKLLANAQEDMLTYLGVRKTVELKYVMERLHSDEAERKWSPADMITYLSGQQQDMRDEDIEFLKANDVVASEIKGDDRLHRACDLYQPTDDHRGLKLAVLKWPTDWNPRSTEAAFLFRIGLNQYPSVQTVINLAATADSPQFRDKALAYFLRYFDENRYRGLYNSRLPTKFLPATVTKGDKKETLIVAPYECYSSSQVEIFEFPVLREELQVEAWKFGVAMYPPIEMVVQRLTAKPPKTVELANKMFNYMAGNLSELGSRDVAKLRDSEFVPVVKDGVTVFKYQAPSRIFIQDRSINDSNSSDLFYKNFFDFVSFDIGSNAFLRYCGARDKPSVVELARSTVAEPNAMFVQAGSATRYMELLIEFEKHWTDVSSEAGLVDNMKKSSFLIAKKFLEKEVKPQHENVNGEKAVDNEVDDYEDLVEEDVSYVLAKAEDTVVNDDVVNYNFFKKEIMSAPFDTNLEKLYTRIGSPKMSHIVQEKKLIGAAINSSDSAGVRKRILERLKLYLDGGSHEKLKVTTSSFEKQFLVGSVSKISVQRSIIRMRGRRFEPVTTHTTATIMRRTDGGYTLYLVPKFEWFDVAQSLVKVILERPTPDAATVLESLLNSSLTGLERRGYNVKRLLNSRRQEARLAQEAAEQQLLAEARERERLKKEAEERAAEELASKHQVYDSKSKEDLLLPPAVKPDRIGREIAPLGKNPGSSLPEPIALPTSAPTPLNLPKQQNHDLFGGMFKHWKKPGRKGLDPSGSSLLAGTASIAGMTPRESMSTQDDFPSPAPAPAPMPTPNVTRTPGAWEDSSPFPGSGGATSMLQRDDNAHREPLTDAATRQLLQEGIRHVAPYGDNELSNSANTWVPDEEVTESASVSAEKMCDRNVAHDLRYVGLVSSTGPKLFVSQSVPDGIPNELIGHTKFFAATLRELAVGVFGARWDAFHMFYDAAGASVAFNLGGSLFFNLRYFVDDIRTTQVISQGATGFSMAKALDYWFPVVAHELAHNLVQSHGQEHSYFTETYIQKFAGSYRRIARMHDT
ncbi:hypothetical protein V1525DRAFT_391431 [Lipomyces kononenkoae]|uniref:Uncharacterized protein n=1 Tax=Lipomyces kononenkoae TaxID=34357 RepID=A0ACC3SSR6_LIPKO